MILPLLQLKTRLVSLEIGCPVVPIDTDNHRTHLFVVLHGQVSLRYTIHTSTSIFNLVFKTLFTPAGIVSNKRTCFLLKEVDIITLPQSNLSQSFFNVTNQLVWILAN